MRLDLSPLAPEELPVLPFDIVWEGARGDFAIEDDPARQGAGGFRQRAPIASAVIMLLFSDARCAVADLKLGLGGDRRGWPGDGFDVRTDLGEAPLGSLLWLRRRSTLVDATPAQIAADALAALQPLVTQRAAAEVKASARILDKALGAVELDVEVIGRDGTQSYAGRFGPLWARIGFDGGGEPA